MPSRAILLGLDFDGTLAPIVADPAQAQVDGEMMGLLTEVGRRLQQVAVISGRDADQLAARLPIAGLMFVGNHGLEERRAGATTVLPEVVPWLPALERAASAFERGEPAPEPGVWLERKLASLSVHYRNAADPGASQARLESTLTRIAAREGLALQRGRLVWELRPPVSLDKGEVLRRLAAALAPRGIVYIGDDATDADAFNALKSLGGRSTLAVGVRSAEVPPAVLKGCDLLVDGVEGVKTFLSALIHRTEDSEA